MFKKTIITLLTATTIFSGIAAFNSTRLTANLSRHHGKRKAN